MRNLLDGILHVRLFPDRHALRNQQGKSALAEILQQDLLALHGFQVLRQIIQQVVFCFGGRHAENRRHHQRQAQDNHQHPMLNKTFCKSFQRFSLL